MNMPTTDSTENTTQYDNEMKGVLFKNQNKRSGNSPSMSGTVQIDGHTWRLAAWTRTDRKGNTYLSLAVSEPQPRADATDVASDQSDVPTDDDLGF